MLSILGGTLGASLLARFWLNQDVQTDPITELESLLANRKKSNAAPIVSPKEVPTTDNYYTDESEEDTETDVIPNDDFPLRLGSQGPRVAKLQVWLLRNYGWTGKVTDLLDEKTEKQMKRFLKTDALDQATYERLKLDAPLHQQKIIR